LLGVTSPVAPDPSGLSGRSISHFRVLERAAADHAFMLYLGIDPIYRSLYDEPRFQALLKRIGIVR
jgi:hypothetical protein